MVIRGICCLIPGVRGKTENIQVRSIVMFFRAFPYLYFWNTGAGKSLHSFCRF